MGEEVGDALKSFRASIRGGLKSAKEKREAREAEASAAKGGQVKRMRYGGEPDSGMDMGQPMRGMAPNPRGRGFPMRDPYANQSQPMKAGGSVKKMAYGGSTDDGMAMGQPMRGMAPTPAPRGRGMQPYPEPMIESPRSPIEPPPKQPKGLPGQTPEDLIQEKNRKIFNSGMMQPSRPGGSPQIDGPGIKAGGQVKKMAQGGYAKADGVASRGKTQPKMVKMAKGGFVKTADGCAKRGKTKAFQVKMKRGGMC
jgi:hypothetical protein